MGANEGLRRTAMGVLHFVHTTGRLLLEYLYVLEFVKKRENHFPNKKIALLDTTSTETGKISCFQTIGLENCHVGRTNLQKKGTF